MKKLLILLSIVLFSQAGIDDLLTNNPFNLSLTQKNMDNIKIGAGLVIGGLVLKGILNAPHQIHKIKSESQQKRDDLLKEFVDNTRNQDKVPVGGNCYNALDRHYHNKLNQINRREALGVGFWYSVPVLSTLGSLGALFYWWNSK